MNNNSNSKVTYFNRKLKRFVTFYQKTNNVNRIENEDVKTITFDEIDEVINSK